MTDLREAWQLLNIAIARVRIDAAIAEEEEAPDYELEHVLSLLGDVQKALAAPPVEQPDGPEQECAARKACREIKRLTAGSQCGVSGVCDGLIGHLMELAAEGLAHPCPSALTLNAAIGDWPVLWHEYAQAPDESLTVDAQQLKRRLLVLAAMVQSIAGNADPRITEGLAREKANGEFMRKQDDVITKLRGEIRALEIRRP